jgi:phasin family protein
MWSGAALPGFVRYTNRTLREALAPHCSRPLKYFISLHFTPYIRSRQKLLVQCTKISLTGTRPLPRMNLLRRTNPRPECSVRNTAMPTVTSSVSDLGRATVEAAAKVARISMDSAERAATVQIEYAKGAVSQATINARALSQVKDVQSFLAVPTRIAENTLENMMGYSRSLYEVAAAAQSEYSRLAEERMASFQQAIAESMDEAGRSAPAGGDVAVAAMKSQLAAATAAFDTFAKAAKNMASYADAGVAATRASKRK